MKNIMKSRKAGMVTKKSLALMITLVMIVSVFGTVFNLVYARVDTGRIELMNITEQTAGYAIYKDAAGTRMGRIIGIQGVSDVGTLTPSGDSNVYNWTGLRDGTYRFKLEVEGDYNVNVLAGNVPAALTPVPEEGDGVYTFEVTITGSSNFVAIQPEFTPNNQGPGGPGGPGGPEGPSLEIIAVFEGANYQVASDLDGNIFLPEGWTGGNISFYADGEERFNIVMPANREQVNNTIETRGSGDDTVLYIDEDFMDYGKATIHLIKGTIMEPEINCVVNLISEDLILLKAEADIEMSYSVGTVDLDNAILTSTQKGRVSIFFGNTEATLIALGPKVQRITEVTGATRTINEDGSAEINLPDLSVETTTTVTVTIELEGGETVTKTIDIARTAITLQFNKGDGDATLQAGYVINKGYLYNNQDHNDEIFDAYFQVILYKDNVVAGYKQIKIDDEEMVNMLRDNEAGSIEMLGDEPINLYGKYFNDTIEGVNKASVFLTNGPIDFDSDTLPSVEFGIGSGVTIEFGGEE